MDRLPLTGDDAELLEPFPAPKFQFNPLWYVLILTLCVSTLVLRLVFATVFKPDSHYQVCCTQTSPPIESTCPIWALSIFIRNASNPQYFVRVESEQGTIKLNLEYLRQKGRADTYLDFPEPETIGIRLYSPDGEPRSEIFYYPVEQNVCTILVEFR